MKRLLGWFRAPVPPEPFTHCPKCGSAFAPVGQEPDDITWKLMSKREQRTVRYCQECDQFRFPARS